MDAEVWRGCATMAEPSSSVRSLRRRVEELEAEMQETRRLNRRLAELMDVVEELLVPISQRDEEKVRQFLSSNTTALGGTSARETGPGARPLSSRCRETSRRERGNRSVASRVFLHVGLPKTGTTFLQTTMWANRRQLRKQRPALPGHAAP